MKSFSRTIAGKTLSMILCLLSLCLLVGCIFGAATMIDFDFYTRPEQTVYMDMVGSSLQQEGYYILADYLDIEPEWKASENLEYLVKNPEGTFLSWRCQDTSSDWLVEYCYQVNTDRNGEPDEIFYADDGAQGTSIYTVSFRFAAGLPANDSYALSVQWVHVGYVLRYWIYAIGLLSLLLAIGAFVSLMSAAGRKSGKDEPVPGLLQRVPFDLLLVCYIALCSMCTNLVSVGGLLSTIACILLCILFVAGGLGLCMSLSARIKTHTLLNYLLITRCLRGLGKVCRFALRALSKLPMVWRTAVIVFGVSFLEFLLMLAIWNKDGMLLLWLIGQAVVCGVALYLALCLRTLEHGGKALAAGNLAYHTETAHLPWALKTHGENLNSIAVGMNAAVEERMKSERMKTELITNVSHDLKTPLTSIVNYAGLIAAEPCENEKITQYAQVLTRQSERLKRLIEDLVEASKASTGTLDVALTPCDAAVFLTQASGEYEERLQGAGLTLITKIPEEPLKILADGRRMWRIFDNLMNNICKYAMEGTRVYLTLEQMSDCAVITFKNTSRQQLDVSEAELMERFVRGDSARNTEGNGLGLSIARSLAELQKGSLRLHIDGDLFKAILIFPCLP